MNNKALSNKFQFVLEDEDVSKSIIAINLPGLNLGVIDHATHVRKLYYPGDSIEINEISVTFICDSDMKNWEYFFNWIIIMRDLSEDLYDIWFKDASMIILNAKRHPLLTINMQNIFPYTITDLPFNVQVDDTEEITFDVLFKVNHIDIKRD